MDATQQLPDLESEDAIREFERLALEDDSSRSEAELSEDLDSTPFDASADEEEEWKGGKFGTPTLSTKRNSHSIEDEIRMQLLELNAMHVQMQMELLKKLDLLSQQRQAEQLQQHQQQHRKSRANSSRRRTAPAFSTPAILQHPPSTTTNSPASVKEVAFLIDSNQPTSIKRRTHARKLTSCLN